MQVNHSRLGRSLKDLLGFLTEIHALGLGLYLHQQTCRAAHQRQRERETVEGHSLKGNLRGSASECQGKRPDQTLGRHSPVAGPHVEHGLPARSENAYHSRQFFRHLGTRGQ